MSQGRESSIPGPWLELVLADVSELILGKVHKQQDRRQFPIKVELIFQKSLLRS
jgi:hypothetical protein